MRGATWRVSSVVAATVVATLSTLSAASDAKGPSFVSPMVCPVSLTSLPADPNTLPWEKSSYRANFTSYQLARQVMSCETKFRPAETAFYAEVALIGLNATPHFVFQNQNMWLADTAGVLTPQMDFANLGIPRLTFEDGPNGIYYHPPSSQFQPTVLTNELALAATMSPPLAQLYGNQLGQESTAFHYLGVQSPDLNLDRIPNWGRSPETFGEDPMLAGAMGSQETVGKIGRAHV